MELSVTDRTDADDRWVLSLTGSLDLGTRGVLKDKAAAALATDAPGLVLDLSGVSFFDSSGLGAVVEVAGDAEDAGKSFALRAPSPRVMRVLSIAGLTDVWSIEAMDD